jgi:hypothetical protein
MAVRNLLKIGKAERFRKRAFPLVKASCGAALQYRTDCGLAGTHAVDHRHAAPRRVVQALFLPSETQGGD